MHELNPVICSIDKNGSSSDGTDDEASDADDGDEERARGGKRAALRRGRMKKNQLVNRGGKGNGKNSVPNPTAILRKHVKETKGDRVQKALDGIKAVPDPCGDGKSAGGLLEM